MQVLILLATSFMNHAKDVKSSQISLQDSSNGGATRTASSMASVGRFSAMSTRIKSGNETGAADAAGRKGSQSSTIREEGFKA